MLQTCPLRVHILVNNVFEDYEHERCYKTKTRKSMDIRSCMRVPLAFFFFLYKVYLKIYVHNVMAVRPGTL